MATIYDVDLMGLLDLPAGKADKPAPAPADPKMLRGGPGPRARKRPPAGPAPGAGVRGTWFNFIRVDVRHAFFNGDDQVCEDLVILPTEETKRRLALFGLIVRCRADGFDLLWDSAQRDNAATALDPLRKLIAALKPAERAAALVSLNEQFFEPGLLFTVALANPRFANFTAMPSDIRIGEPPLFLSTQAATPRDDEERSADLTVDWKVQVIRPDPRPDGVPPPDNPHVVAKAPVIAERERLKARSHDFALLEVHFMRSAGEPPANGAWDGMPVSFDGGKDAIFQACAYTISFAARETHWRYFVATRDGTPPVTAGLAVVAADGSDAGFELAGESTILPDGREAACLASRDPLPILARPDRIFSLKGVATGGRRRTITLVDRLPAAGTDSIAPMDPSTFPPRAGEPPPSWSDMYVFV
ncbi:MAG TPA: hypothetical protein VIT38_00790 [Allosphingosinicella sp.]